MCGEVMCGGVNTGRSTGGVRGCKASAWEGGIRVPGFLVYPAKIASHRETWVPAVTHDFLPTIMEVFGPGRHCHLLHHHSSGNRDLP